MIGLYILLVASFLSMIRVIIGPTIVDRLISMNMFVTLIVILTVYYLKEILNPILIDIGIVLTLLSFLGTLMFTIYLREANDR